MLTCLVTDTAPGPDCGVAGALNPALTIRVKLQVDRMEQAEVSGVKRISSPSPQLRESDRPARLLWCGMRVFPTHITMFKNGLKIWPPGEERKGAAMRPITHPGRPSHHTRNSEFTEEPIP